MMFIIWIEVKCLQQSYKEKEGKVEVKCFKIS